MDCEKVEAALMDELYGELDELTSASVKRHVAGCANCLALLGGLRATRSVAVVPMVEPPVGLEQRILDAAARVSPPPTPLRRRFAGALSVAGGWAMRPQTAMATLFLVTLGTSVLLLHGRSSRAPAIAPITVVEEGSPAPAAAPFPSASAVAPFDSPGGPRGEAPRAALAAGRPEPSLDGVATAREHLAVPATKAGRSSPADGELALRDDISDRAAARKTSPLAGPSRASAGGAGASPAAENSPAFAAAPPAAAPATPAGMPMAAAPAEAAGAAAADQATAAASPFDVAMAAYRAKRFDEARRDFDALAGSDPNADLWSARSLRESRGCGVAGPRFDEVAQRASGMTVGWQAQLEGARCYAATGDAAAARARLRSLLSVDAFHARAQAELDKLSRAPGGP